MNTITINASTARWLAVNAQLLNYDVSESTGNDDLYRVINRLGYVQIDTLTVVERAHHHTLWNRQPGYRNEVLENFLGCERKVFEYWAHAMSYVPMHDYRFYMPRMRSFFDPIGKWEKERLEKYGNLMQPVLEQLRIDGPLTSSDVKFNVEAHPEGNNWNPNPCKAALELLLLRGDVMVTQRRNFQRVYDLTERVLPAGIDTRFPSDDELGCFLVKRALMAHGVVRERDISLHIDAAHNSLISNCLRQMVENNEVCMVQLEENRKIKMFVEPGVLTAASDNCEMKKTVHLLSPFDNLLFSRDRIKQLFDFDYRLECYIPASRRKFGYFALPILWGDRLVGQLDCKADRKHNLLVLHKFALEPSFNEFESFLPYFIKAIIAFARFNMCKFVRIDTVTPDKFKPCLIQLLEEKGFAI